MSLKGNFRDVILEIRSVRCREVEERDGAAVVALLTKGYRHERNSAFWERAIGRLAERESEGRYPRFGYLLECGGEVVGVILLIFARLPDGVATVLRCNLSSWYVAEAFRPYGSMLISRALRHREATYLNITPASHTLPILAAQGFMRYCDGRAITLPSLSRRGRRGVRIERLSAAAAPGGGLTGAELELLRTHAAWGCVSLIGTVAERRVPFVLALRRAGAVPFAVLTYCRDLDDYAAFAGAIGWFMLRRGHALVVIDANGPVEGIPGWYSGGRPKYARGAHIPRLGDCAYTERAMLGS